MTFFYEAEMQEELMLPFILTTSRNNLLLDSYPAKGEKFTVCGDCLTYPEEQSGTLAETSTYLWKDSTQDCCICKAPNPKNKDS